jgi:hypothetical protein
MNLRKFFSELKRRNVYSVAIPVVVWLGYRRYGSLKSFTCSCVSITLPELRVPVSSSQAAQRMHPRVC